MTSETLLPHCRRKHAIPYVAKEPTLQPLSGETFSYLTANTYAEASVDSRTRGFWSKSQDAYFDVRVFHPNGKCISLAMLPNLVLLFWIHEQVKKEKYR